MNNSLPDIEPNTVGSLNGPWARLARFNLLLAPLFIGATISWGSWVTRELFQLRAFISYGDRFSYTDALKMEDRLEDSIHLLNDRIDSFEKDMFRNYITKEDLKELLQNGR